MEDEDNRRTELVAETWGEVDVDGNGILDADELYSVLMNPSLELPDDVDVEPIMAELDPDGSGVVEFDAFLNWYLNMREEMDSEADLEDLLGDIDLDAFSSDEEEEVEEEEEEEEEEEPAPQEDESDLLAGLDEIEGINAEEEQAQAQAAAAVPEPAAPPAAADTDAASRGVQERVRRFSVEDLAAYTGAPEADGPGAEGQVEAVVDSVATALGIEPEQRTEEEVMVLFDWSEHVASTFFRNLTSSTLRKEVCRRLKGERHPAGHTLFNQGDVGETFYVIVSGEIGILVNGNQVATLGRGGAFGELSLTGEAAEDRQRGASGVTLSGPTILGTLDRVTYRSLIDSMKGWGTDLQQLRENGAVSGGREDGGPPTEVFDVRQDGETMQLRVSCEGIELLLPDGNPSLLRQEGARPLYSLRTAHSHHRGRPVRMHVHMCTRACMTDFRD
eukprot:COSAG05_NODE_2382_length_3145_cov_3.646422_2_plen_446_part_00